MSKVTGLLNFIAQAPGQVFGGLLGPSPLPPGLAGQLPPGYEEQARQQAIQQMAISALSAPRGQQLAQATQAGQTGYRSSLVDMLRMREMERMQGEREKEAQRVERLRNSPDLRAMLGNTAGDLSPQTLETIFAELATAQQASPSSTDDIKEYNFAVDGGTFSGTFLEWLLAQKKAGAATTNIQLPPDQNEWLKTVAKNSANNLDNLYQQAISASNSLDRMRMLRPLVESPNFTSGPLKETLVYLQDALGLGSTDETRAFFALIGQEVAERIKAFGSGTGLSDADREFAAKIAGGSMELTPDAILRIMDINERSSLQVMNRYASRRSTLGKNSPEVFDYYEELPIPSGPWNKYK